MTYLAHIPTLADGLLSWLLGDPKFDPTNPEVVVAWRFDVPLWGWLLIMLAVGAIAWVSYRKLIGARGGRAAMAGARGLILLGIIVLLCGPSMVLPREDVERDHILFLVDRSPSITVSDVAEDPTARNVRISREDQLRKLLGEHGEVWTKLAEEHELDWYAFADEIDAVAGPDAIGDTTGRATAMRSAIETALRRAAGKPISAVVVFSDGRSSEQIGPEVWQIVRQTGAKLHAVPLGAEDPPLDLAIQRIDAPDRAFVDDTVVVQATVNQLGGAPGSDGGADAPPGTKLELVDAATGEVLDSKPIDRLDEAVRLMHTPKAAGAVSWKLRLSTDEPELVVDNNNEQIDLSLVDRPIRVLYIEGYPRWEYRYLKNIMLREESIESSIMLISADRTFAQEGDVPLRRLPMDEEEMKPYDVVVIGDVSASFFSAGQLKLIEQQIAVHGAGLLWLGGSQHMPGSYTNTDLAKLLPMTEAAFDNPTLGAPIVVEPTPVADALGVLRLKDTDGPADVGGGDSGGVYWPSTLPPLTWAQDIKPLKPTAEALAADANTGSPLVVRMRYPPGMTLYVATDEIWRWRYARGDLYPEQFYMQLIRMLARSRLASGSDETDRARLSISHRRAVTGDTVVVELQLLDPSLVASAGEAIEVDITPADADGNPRSGVDAQRITLTKDEDRPGVYTAAWEARQDGKLVLNVASPGLAALGLEQTITVNRSDDEMRYPAADHATLAELADRTGGKVFTKADLPTLPESIDNRARRTPADISEPLWNTPLAFALLIILLTIEWIGRKVLGLA